MKWRRVIGLFSIFAVFFNSFLPFKSFANERETSDSELLELYEKLDYILHLDNGWLYNDVIRSFLWGVVTTLKWLNNLIEQSVHKIITMNDFYSSPAMQELMKIARPLVFGLFLIALIVLGFQFMLNKIEKRNEILLNVLMAVSIVIVIPVLMSTANEILGEGLNYVEKEQGTVAGEMIKSNVADLQYYIDKGFSTDLSNKYYGNNTTPPTPLYKDDPSIGTTDFKYGNKLSANNPNLAVNEKLDIQADSGWFPWTTEQWVKDLKSNNSRAYDFLLHQRIPAGSGDNYRIKQLAENKIPATSLGQESYYRWHVNWGVLIISLIVTTIALIITVVKIGRAIFDLAFHQIFGMFVAVTDITGGQRIKKVLVEIANTFGVLFVMVFLLKIFMLYSNWVNGLKNDIGSLAVVLLLIAGAWAVIDAPDIVQRVMGIDAGLRSGWQAMMGAYAGARVAGGVGKGITKGVGAATKGAGGAYSGMKGMIRGAGTNPSPTTQKSGTNVQPEDSRSVTDNNLNDFNTGESSDDSEMKGVSSEKTINNSGESNNTSTGRNIPQSSSESSSGSSRGGLSGKTFDMTPSQSSPGSIPQKPTVKKSPRLSGSSGNHRQPFGHKSPQFKNTLVDGMRSVRDTKAFMARAENTGFDVGQKIRKIGRASGKGAINTARAIRHPMQTAKYAGTIAKAKTNEAINSSVKGVRAATISTVDKTKDIIRQINMPIGKSIQNNDTTNKNGGPEDGI